MPAKTWATWRDSLFGDPEVICDDGPDFGALTEMVRSDGALVATMLRAGLRAGDPLAAQSIGELALANLAPRDAHVHLKAVAPGSTGEFRIRVAQALRQLTKDESCSSLVISVLADAHAHWGTRLNAAMVLTEFAPTAPILDAFKAGVLDPEYLVRYQCADGLLKAAGRRPDISEHPQMYELITAPGTGVPTDGDRRAWKAVAELLMTMVRVNLS